MKSDYHRGTIVLTNGIHNNIHLIQEKSRHHINSVSVIETVKSTSTLLTSSGSSSGNTVVGYTNGSQVKGSGNMSVHDDQRITHKVNLAAAFHDHISCTKLPSQISKNGGDINSLIGASLSNGSCIDTNNSLFGAAAGSSNEDKIQIKKLKDMILMQLDLIQHQQEQLLKKERQLQGLKQDRETLCVKIDKMENRLNFLTKKLLEANSTETASPGISDNNTHPESIQQQQSTASSTSTFTSTESSTSTSKSTSKSTSTSTSTATATSTSTALSTSTSTSTSTGTTTTISASELLATSSTTTTTTTISSKNNSTQVNKDDILSMDSKPANSESINSNEENSSSQPSSKKRRRTISKSGTSTPSDQQQPVNNVNCKSTSTNINVLETDEPYDLYNCRQEKSVIQRLESSTSDTTIRINQIEVPSWRIINLPDSNSTVGIESLDDDTFLKRHQKLENDEKRRKRWDIQRLREQKLNEKLRSGRYYYSAVNFDKPICSTGQSKQLALDLKSFFQDPKEVQFIEVSDKIPVMAFGLPIPKLPPKPFTLPWLKSSRQP